MKYISTRGNAPAKNFTEILLGGLAPDGGLYLPEQYPQVTRAELDAWRKLSYADLAYAVLSKFITDIPAADLKAIIGKTYTTAVYSNGRADSDFTQITPLRTLEPGVHILELSNGPTLAFKDMAMQLLGNLFEYALDKQHAELNILGADFRRHRFRCRICDARQARHPRVHAVAAWQDVGLPARADVFSAGSEHLQHRDQRHVRRRAGHGEGDIQRPCIQGEIQDRHGQFDQLGTRVGAGGLLLQGLLCRDETRTTNRSRSRCRPAISATSAPGTSRA